VSPALLTPEVGVEPTLEVGLPLLLTSRESPSTGMWRFGSTLVYALADEAVVACPEGGPDAEPVRVRRT
jgi:hypothetical protein